MAIKFQHPDHDSSKLRQSILEVLETTPLCAIATINEDKTSHINTAYFCYDSEFNFYFLTSPSAKHSINILKNDSVAISIFSTNQPWGENPLRGIQIFGTARLTNSLDEKKGYDEYAKRFPGFLTWMNSLNKEEKDKVESKFYSFNPKRIKLLDEKTFGEETYISINL